MPKDVKRFERCSSYFRWNIRIDRVILTWWRKNTVIATPFFLADHGHRVKRWFCGRMQLRLHAA